MHTLEKVLIYVFHYAIHLHCAVAPRGQTPCSRHRLCAERSPQNATAGYPGRGGKRVGGKGSKTDFPESATPSEVSMKLHSCGAHNRSRAGFGAPTPPDMTLTSRAMASSPFPLAGSLAAILLPLHVPILGSGRHQASSRALPSPSWGESAKMTSRTG